MPSRTAGGRSAGREQREFVLAAVARAGVDVTDREAPAAVGARERDACGGGGGGRGEASASAIRAGVAELEALVDQREVGQQVVRGGVRDCRPVGVGAGAEVEPLDAVAVALDDAGRCATRALDAADPDRLRPARRGAPPPGGSVGRAGARGRRMSAAARARAARRAPGRRRRPAWDDAARSRRTRAAGLWPRTSSASPAARAAGPTAPSRSASAASTIADVGQPVLERGVEERARARRAPSPSRSAASSARAALDGRASRSSSLPPTLTVPKRKRWPVSARVQAAGALRQRGEARVAGREPDAGADGGDVVEVVPGALELEQDRSCTGQLGGRPRGRAPPRRRGRRRRRWQRRRRRTRARRTPCPASSDAALGGPLEAAVLVEEAGVEVEDPVAHDVEAEVPRLDHARVDRPDRDLVGVHSRDRHGPAAEVGVVVDERPQRLVAGEADAVEIVRLALVPARGRGRGRRSTAPRRPRPRRSRVESSRLARRAASARASRRRVA